MLSVKHPNAPYHANSENDVQVMIILYTIRSAVHNNYATFPSSN